MDPLRGGSRSAPSFSRPKVYLTRSQVQVGGKLPATAEGFIPMLGAWPKDPYNGKPMIYDARTEKVYSVGQNLIDDGGAIGPHGSLDVGVSLRP